MWVEVANLGIRLPNIKIQEDLTSAFAHMWEKSTTFAAKVGKTDNIVYFNYGFADKN